MERTTLIRRIGFIARQVTQGHQMRQGNNAAVRAEEEPGDSAKDSQRKVKRSNFLGLRGPRGLCFYWYTGLVKF